MKDVILRNGRALQYICAAKKNFITENGFVSESHSKMLICHFSDMHCDWKRFENILSVIDYFSPTFAVHTGDLVCWDSQDDTQYFFDRIRQSDVPIYNCIGNHETFRQNEVLSNACLHGQYIRPLRHIQGDDYGEGYYYVDFPEYTVRLIVLNNYENEDVPAYYMRHYEIRQKQADWLIATLKECEGNGYAVMIASHESDQEVPPNSDTGGFCQRYSPFPWSIPAPNEHHIVADIIDAFQYGKALKNEYVWSASGATVQVDCRFEKKSEFICYMNGHRHGDYIGYLPAYPNQLSLGVTCAGCFPEGYHNIGDETSDLPRIPDTVSEDAFNFYGIDREKKEITVVRVGACVNDRLEERLYARYSYGIDK